jgi:MinD superfamily P-loop ATPase
MREIAVISGKGGTGKSSFVLSLLPYIKNSVIADCDVDAPDLKVLLNKEADTKTPFFGFEAPMFDMTKCIHCGACVQHCNFNAINDDITLKEGACEGCSACEYVCPTNAIHMAPHQTGHVFTRDTLYGPLVDAMLFPGEESSGKLVTAVRQKSQDIAKKQSKDMILIDGSPGVACNVISTITGVDKAYIVTEPTVSGLHDLKRVIDLIRIFNTDVSVIINKTGINPQKEQAIIDYCETEQLDLALKIPFDKEITNAISRLDIPSTTSIPFFQSSMWQAFIKDFLKLLN